MRKKNWKSWIIVWICPVVMWIRSICFRIYTRTQLSSTMRIRKGCKKSEYAAFIEDEYILISVNAFKYIRFSCPSIHTHSLHTYTSIVLPTALQIRIIVCRVRIRIWNGWLWILDPQYFPTVPKISDSIPSVNTVRHFLADFAVFDCWRYCKALCDVMFVK